MPCFIQAQFPQMLWNDGTPTFSIMLKLSDYMSDLPQEEQELYENLLIFGSSHERHEAYMQHLYLNWGTCHTLSELQDDWGSVAYEGVPYPMVFSEAEVVIGVL
ncbi:hypothetical protein K443DRAFT_13477 [Laccaria amethystina LaAM-08-1]|uniref:Uncharacterized protein n=1 Tax=Laccaria amethystina LaAM-08-1 TaxID=1095629 RepID=A0A0C9X8F3_9AGAR|nr:hypothetical protein K443DRAFT_13477 [Laccaria amethystina LaAM-08-1]